MENQQSAKAIFDQALGIEAVDERRSFLEQTCAGNVELRRKVDGLLEAYNQAGSFLESTPAALGATVDMLPVSERPGTVVGNYKLMEQIGEGGMGLVFVAQQLRPIRRKVALKIIKPGMDTREVISRFEAERQVLALMDHPHIAGVLDAGATDTGRPYFVMELVRGIPITEYCDQNLLTPSERLELLVNVCQAIQHAHHKGIIHRDVKPNNVLVTLHDGRPVVKVIDFGVSKAINQQLTEFTVYTRFSQMIGTPLYMSPEQAEMSGLDVDVRSDIYSLGVLLYELLTGATPFDKQRIVEAGYDEMRRIIREEEPPKPSTRLSTLGDTLTMVATRRKMEPTKLSTFLRGDLDSIVMKAMEKDRTRRYETANAFARDIERYLNDEPVTACPPSAAYRFRKFARRNKGLLTAMLAVAAVLLLGTIVSTVLAIFAIRAERLANQRLLSEKRAHVEADQSAKQARGAEREAKRRLFDSHVSHAKASRMSGQPGQRVDAIEAIRQAADFVEPLQLGDQARAELRDEFIAAMSLVDLKMVRQYRVIPNTNCRVAVAADLQHYVLIDPTSGKLGLRDLDDVNRQGPALPFAMSWLRSRFSSDSHLLAIPQAADITVWDIEKQKTIVQLSFKGPITSTSFSPDGRQLAIGVADRSVEIYSMTTGQLSYTHPAAQAHVSKLRFSPDGRRLAVAIRDSETIEIRDVVTGDVRIRLPLSHDKRVYSLAWGPNGQALAAGCFKEINLWDLRQPSRSPILMPGHESAIDFLDFHPSGTFLTSCSWDGTTRHWESATGYQLLQMSEAFRSFSADGRYMVTIKGLEIRVWEVILPEGTQWMYANQRCSAVALSPDERLLALGFKSGVRIYDLAFNREVGNLPLGWTRGLLFHPVDGRLVTSSPEGVFAWPVRAGREDAIHQWEIGPPLILDRAFRRGSSFLDMSDDGLTAIAQVANTSMANLVRGLGDSRKAFVLKQDFLAYVALSRDGMLAATGNQGGGDHVSVWNARTGEHVRELPVLGNSMPAFSPDNRWLATNSGDAVRFWGIGDWKMHYSYSASAIVPSPVVFTSDSRIAAIGRRGLGLHLIDMENGEPLAMLRTSQGRPHFESMCFTNDGGRLVVTRGDAGVCIWDLRLIRERLAQLGLDWDQPSIPPPHRPSTVAPVEVTILLGGMKARSLLARPFDARVGAANAWSQAMADLAIALDRAPDNSELYYLRGHLNLLIHDYRTAIKEFDQVIQRDSANPGEALYYRGWANRRLRNVQAAMDDYESAVQFLPQSARALNELAAIYALDSRDDAQLERALELSRRSHGLRANDAAQFNTLGCVLYRLQRYNEAEGAVRKYFELAGKRVMPHPNFILAAIHHDRGETDEARAAYEKAEEITRHTDFEQHVAIQIESLRAEIRDRLEISPSQREPDIVSPVLFEGENLLLTAKAEEGRRGQQSMANYPRRWSGDVQMVWKPVHLGVRLTTQVNLPQAGRYRVSGYLTKATDYGQFQLIVDDKPLGNPFDGFSPTIVRSGEIVFGEVELQDGSHQLVFEIAGRNPESTGHWVGIDQMVFTPVDPANVPPDGGK